MTRLLVLNLISNGMVCYPVFWLIYLYIVILPSSSKFWSFGKNMNNIKQCILPTASVESIIKNKARIRI